MDTNSNDTASRFNMRLPKVLHDEIRRAAKEVGTDTTALIIGIVRSYLLSGLPAQSRMLAGLPMDGRMVFPSTTDNMAIPQFIRDENKAEFMRVFDSIFPEASQLDNASRVLLFNEMVRWRVIRRDDHTFSAPGYYGMPPSDIDKVMSGLVTGAIRKQSINK